MYYLRPDPPRLPGLTCPLPLTLGYFHATISGGVGVIQLQEHR
jgi:hypothetical protein